jgi:phosphatidylglycerol---prolipoprotein diacylglyceryl transferase
MNVQQILMAGPYNLFYAAGFVCAFLIAWRSAARNGVKPGALAIFLIAVSAAGMIGSRFLPFDLNAIVDGEKTVLGGLMAATLVALAMRRSGLIDERATNALALGLPIGFAIGRIGCFLAGCCFGRPTALPWGMQYLPGSEPFSRQVSLGLIQPNALSTLPVHPTQLYEAAAALAIACVAVLIMRRGCRDILVHVVVLPFFASRFMLQFLRGQGGEFGVVHALLVLSAITLWLIHRSARSRPVGAPGTSSPLMLAGAVALLAARVATPLELVTLMAIGGLTAFVFTMRARRSALPTFAAVIALQQADPVTTYPIRFITVGASAMGGEYDESCGGRHEFGMAGASAGYTSKPNAISEITVKGRVFAGTDKELSPAELEGEPENPKTDVNGGAIAVHGRYKWVGASLGIVGGNLFLDGEPESVLPVIGVRLGPQRFFVEGRFGDFEPAPVPLPGIQLGIGSTYNAQGSTLRIGIGGGGVYGSALIVTRDWEVEPTIATEGFDNAPTHMFGLAVRKRISLRK